MPHFIVGSRRVDPNKSHEGKHGKFVPVCLEAKHAPGKYPPHVGAKEQAKHARKMAKQGGIK